LKRFNRINECLAGITGTEYSRKGETKKKQKQQLAKAAEGVAGGVFALENKEGTVR